ncbi:site-specific integrase [Bacillus sp. PS06]|uniref:site-specific integrase n=1 Tax=Bacillus sp. PS06 TaxID=2764176 RepID=UPI001786B738|nr:site-specific integrase [Bacillus sp. PS06]MBD8071279.1 site-specific integrase [Bacillus sp. PS06]
MTVSFKINQEIELLDEFSDEKFDITYSIEQAKEILKDENNKSDITECYFEKSIWTMENPVTKTRINLNFIDFNNTFTNSDLIAKKDFILIVKCWTANIIKTRSAPLVKKYLNKIIEFIEITECFLIKDEEKIRNILKRENEENRYLIAYTMLNFFDFYEELDSDSIYTQILIDVKEELNVTGNRAVRKLPKSKDILMFSWFLDDFFRQVEPRSNEYYYYYPLYIWWNLTNLIPMRPSEFCKIHRDCLFIENKKTYIRLPRYKQPKYKSQIQVIDKIRIPSNMYQEIEEYIEQTTMFGESKTLISYRSVAHNGTQNQMRNKVDPDYFTLDILGKILKNFYKYIITNIYGKTIKPYAKVDKEISILDRKDDREDFYDIDQQIRPGDTRHFAFLNLMRQGYHPVEIARLGGHTTVRAQYHYHQHTEYWVDTDVLKLMIRFNLDEQKKKQSVGDRSSLNEIPSALSDEFKKKFIFKPPTCEKTKRKMKIGYCTDPLQLCRVKHCMLCDDWRISTDEYLEKTRQIEEIIKESKRDVDRLTSTLLNLYKLALSNSSDLEFQEHNMQINQDLTLASKELEEAINNYAKMLSISERVED